MAGLSWEASPASHGNESYSARAGAHPEGKPEASWSPHAIWILKRIHQVWSTTAAFKLPLLQFVWQSWPISPPHTSFLPQSSGKVGGMGRLPGMTARAPSMSVCGLSLRPACHMRIRKFPSIHALNIYPLLLNFLSLPILTRLPCSLMTALFLPEATHPCGLPL